MERKIFLKKYRLIGCPYVAAEKYRIPSGENFVWLTDDAESAAGLVQDGACVIWLLTAENRGTFCTEAEWCVEVPATASWREQLTEKNLPDWLPQEFLWRVWQRKNGLPWQICETKRLYLREITEADLDFLYLCSQDPLAAQFVEVPGADRDTELEKIKAYRQLMYGFYGFGLWLVLEKESGRPVGRAGLQMREGYEIPELGVETEHSFRRKGYAREALEAVLAYAKEELELPSLRSVVDAENTASQKLCESLGFTVDKRKEQNGKNWIFYSRK